MLYSNEIASWQAGTAAAAAAAFLLLLLFLLLPVDDGVRHSPAPTVHLLVSFADRQRVLCSTAYAAYVFVEHGVNRFRLRALLCIPMTKLTVFATTPRGYHVAIWKKRALGLDWASANAANARRCIIVRSPRRATVWALPQLTVSTDAGSVR